MSKNPDKKEAFAVISIDLSDYKSVCIGNNATNRIICHMNTLDGDYDELLLLANTMCDALNSKHAKHE